MMSFSRHRPQIGAGCGDASGASNQASRDSRIKGRLPGFLADCSAGPMPNGRVLAAFCVVCMGITVGAIASALVAPSGSSFSLDSWGPHAPKARDSAQFPWNVAKQKSWREQNQSGVLDGPSVGLDDPEHEEVLEDNEEEGEEEEGEDEQEEDVTEPMKQLSIAHLAETCERGTTLFDRVAKERYKVNLKRMSPDMADGIAAKTLLVQTGEVKFPACFKAKFTNVYNVGADKNTTDHLQELIQQKQKVWLFANAFDLLNSVLDLRQKGKLKDRKLLLFTDRIFVTPRSQWRIKTQLLVANLKVPRAVLLDAVFVSVPVYIFKYAARVPNLGRKMIWVPNWAGDEIMDDTLARLLPGGTDSRSIDTAEPDSNDPRYIAGVSHVRLKSKETTDVFMNITKGSKDTRLVAIEKDWGPVRRAIQGTNITFRLAIGGVNTNGLICQGVPNCEEVFIGGPKWPAGGVKEFYQRSAFAIVSVSKWAPRSHGRVSMGRGLKQLQTIQACGKAVIISETSNWVGYLSAGRDAMMVNADDYGPMKAAIRNLLKNKGMAAKLGHSAHRRAMNTHGRMVTERFLAIIAAMLKGGRNWATPWQPAWKIVWRSLLKEAPLPIGDVRTYRGPPWVGNTASIYKAAGAKPKNLKP